VEEEEEQNRISKKKGRLKEGEDLHKCIWKHNQIIIKTIYFLCQWFDL
jgi:hypothetical protein